MTNSSTPSEPNETSTSTEGEEHRGYRVRIEYPNLTRYRYGSYEDGEWYTTIRRKASILPLAKAQEGANYFALTIGLKDGAKVTLEEVLSFDPDWCCAPAGTIGEMLSYHRLSQEEAAQKLGLPSDDMSQLMRGELAIVPELAQKLHEVLGGTPQFWQALETNYREGIRRGLTVFREVL